MKKIDLHIHTIATRSDSHFDFDLAKLVEYVNKLEIDCIAITNHNCFDFNQFNQISDELQIEMFPGIEVDLAGGHMLLICDNRNIADINDFSTKCQIVAAEISSTNDSLSTERFKEIFPNLDQYLLIPHYQKNPIIKNEVIAELDTLITAGEVTSYKKFKACIKDDQALVPVIFSDSRYYQELDTFSTQQTFIDIEEITLSGIKACLTDKQKVFLTREEGNDFFLATDEGLKLSTGLNVIFGGRSTGKTVTLNKINHTHENVKYIKQFSLLQNDEQKFEELLSRRHSSLTEDYLSEFKGAISRVVQIDHKQNKIDLEKYLSTLLKFAFDNDKQDAFSKTVLFSETSYQRKDLSSLKRLINATNLIKENIEYKSIINRHISDKQLLDLEIDLIKEYINIEEDSLKMKWINNLVDKVKDELRFRTSSTIPEEIDFYNILLDNEKIKGFNNLVWELQKERVIETKELRGFKIVASTRKFRNASDLKKVCKRQISLTKAFSKYNNPFQYLMELKKAEIEDTELHKYFVHIKYKTLNQYGFEVSGGERSEFNLLHEINDALKHDMLLIDEPESSFDNIFLKSEVNELLRDISKTIPVIIVTHNNTVGASIKPNYVACTERKIDNDTIVYNIYSGYPFDKELKSASGEIISNYKAMLDCLEAGDDEYIKRRAESYEILKD